MAQMHSMEETKNTHPYTLINTVHTGIRKLVTTCCLENCVVALSTKKVYTWPKKRKANAPDA